MMTSGIRARISAVVLVITGWTGTATAAPAAAIFPFEIYDTSGEAPQSDLTERLAMATRVLSEALEKTGRYSPVDLGPFIAEVTATSPRYRCGDCFLPVARRAGAAFAVVPVVHKVSSLISSMDIWILDASSGASPPFRGGSRRKDAVSRRNWGLDRRRRPQLGPGGPRSV